MSFGAIGLAGAGGLTQILGGVAANNQAKQNADLLRELGEAAADDIRRDFRALQGSQINAHTGDATVGSAVDIAADTAVEGDVSARRAQFQFEAQAHAQEVAGINALVSSVVQGTGTILGGTVAALGQEPIPNSFDRLSPSDAARLRVIAPEAGL